MTMRAFAIAMLVLAAALLPLAPIVVCAIAIAVVLLTAPEQRVRAFERVVCAVQRAALLALTPFRAPPVPLV